MIFSETLLFIISMLITGSLLFLLVYFIITLSDLECDYINAQQCCTRLNMWSVPRICGQGMLCFFFLIHGYFWLFLANLPLSVWTVYELFRVPSGNVGIYDATEIHNRGQLKIHMRDVLIVIGFYLVAFFLYLYLMIVSLLKSDTPGHSFPTTVPGEFDEF